MPDALEYQKINTLDTVEDMPSFLEKQVNVQRTIQEKQKKQQEDNAYAIHNVLETVAKDGYIFNDAYQKEFGDFRNYVIDQFQKNQSNRYAVLNDTKVLQMQQDLIHKAEVGKTAQQFFDTKVAKINSMPADKLTPEDRANELNKLKQQKKDILSSSNPFQKWAEFVASGELDKDVQPSEKTVNAIKAISDNINALKEKAVLGIDTDPNSLTYGKYVSQVPPQAIKASIKMSFSDPKIKADAIDKYHNAIKDNDALKNKYMDMANNDPDMRDPAMQFMYEPHAPIKSLSTAGQSLQDREHNFAITTAQKNRALDISQQNADTNKARAGNINTWIGGNYNGVKAMFVKQNDGSVIVNPTKGKVEPIQVVSDSGDNVSGEITSYDKAKGTMVVRTTEKISNKSIPDRTQVMNPDTKLTTTETVYYTPTKYDRSKLDEQYGGDIEKFEAGQNSQGATPSTNAPQKKKLPGT